MGLNNILKALHSKESSDPSVKPSIEKFFMRKSVANDKDFWLDKMSRFSPSRITYSGVCPRAYNIINQRERLGVEIKQPDSHETSLLRIFDHGHMIHDMYQNKILGPAGVLYGRWSKGEDESLGFMPGEGWTYIEPRVKWPKYKISGYTDGIMFVDNKWVIVEIKSSNNQSFRYMKATNTPRQSHVSQAMIYLFAPNDLDLKGEIDGTIILYINKDTGEELEFFIKKDFSIIQPLLEDITNTLNDFKNNTISPKHIECISQKSPRAKKCEVCTLCFNGDF